jgi:S-adenosylmethionine hydrolase
MQLITLTSDWGTRDYAVAALKASLLGAIPNVQLVDVTHEILRHDIQQAAFVFRNALRYFPSGTLHIVGVHAQVPGRDSELLLVKKDGHIFICMNDGFFSMVFDEKPVDVVTAEMGETPHALFPVKLITECAASLIGGRNLYELGHRPTEFVEKRMFQPTIEDDLIRGVVMYWDRYGNVVTNISRQLFEQQRKGRSFEIVMRRSAYTVYTISPHYGSGEPGSFIALFNDAGFLEIAINEGSAYELLGLRLNDIIRVEFK